MPIDLWTVIEMSKFYEYVMDVIARPFARIMDELKSTLIRAPRHTREKSAAREFGRGVFILGCFMNFIKAHYFTCAFIDELT